MGGYPWSWEEEHEPYRERPLQRGPDRGRYLSILILVSELKPKINQQSGHFPIHYDVVCGEPNHPLTAVKLMQRNPRNELCCLFTTAISYLQS